MEALEPRILLAKDTSLAAITHPVLARARSRAAMLAVPRTDSIGSVLQAPGGRGQAVTARFVFVGRDSAYRSEFGLFLVDDARGRIGELTPGDRGHTASQGGTTLYDVQYARGAVGRITRKVETVGGATTTYDYAYDVNDRLTQVQQAGSTVAAYTYDANGNRLSVTGPAGATTSTSNVQDRLLSYVDSTYTYSPKGEVLSRTEGRRTTTYRHDALGRLVHADMTDGTAIDYLGDSRGRRNGKEVDGVLVQGWLHQDWLWPIAELNGAGNVVVAFVYARRADGPAYLVKCGVTYRVLSDQLGSPRLVAGAARADGLARRPWEPSELPSQRAPPATG